MMITDPIQAAQTALDGKRSRMDTYAAIYLQMKEHEIALEMLKEDGVANDFEAFGKEGKTYGNFVFTHMKGAARMDYTGVKSVEEADAALKALKKEANTALEMKEKFNKDWIDTATGEVLTLPTKTHNRDTVKATEIKN
jgi:hypothetical protein